MKRTGNKKTDMHELYISTVIKQSIFGRKTCAACASKKARITVMCPFFGFMYFCAFLIAVRVLDSDPLKIGSFAGEAAFAIVIAGLLISRANRRRDAFLSWLADFTPGDFKKLCIQAEQSGEMYGTLYLLDGYLYVHGKMQMIRYEDIEGFYVKFRRITAFDRGKKAFVKKCAGAALIIKITGGRTVRIKIAEYSRFEREYSLFEQNLRLRIN